MEPPDDIDAWLGCVYFHDSQRKKKKRIRVLECPLCSYQCSANDQNSGLGVAFLDHLANHKLSFDPSLYRACSNCFISIPGSKVVSRCNQCSSVPEKKSSSLEVIDYSCSVNRYTAIAQRAKLIANNRIPKIISYPLISSDSNFKAVFMNADNARFMDYVNKTFTREGKYASAFIFKVFTAARYKGFGWSCVLCENGEGLLKFSNDISMRLYVLYHLQQYHSEFSDLSSLIADEWNILDKEFFCSLQEVFPSPMAPLSVERTALVYIDDLDDKKKTIVGEMFRRESRATTIDEGCICKLCFHPLSKRRIQKHFECSHKGVPTHYGSSDFFIVEEIAQCSNICLDNFPSILLRYSERHRTLSIDSSMTFFKWKCLIPSCKPGHINDVLEFSSTLLLRMYALRHLETFHANLFSEQFLQREWILANNEAAIADVDLRVYDQNTFESVIGGSDDANDFVFPYLSHVLPDEIGNFHKVCGVCYWSGLPSQFVEHIEIHNYWNSHKHLSSNESLKKVLSAYGIRKNSAVTYKVRKEPRPSTNILGHVGRSWIELMKRGTFSVDDLADECYSGSKSVSDSLDGVKKRISCPPRKSAIEARTKLKSDKSLLRLRDDMSSSSCDDGSGSDNDNRSAFDDEDSDGQLSEVHDSDFHGDELTSSAYLAQTTTESSAACPESDVVDSAENTKDCSNENSKYSERVPQILRNMATLYDASALSNLAMHDLSTTLVNAIQNIADRRCPICPTKAKIVIGVNKKPFTTRELEEAVFGHIVLKHAEDLVSQDLLKIKCSLLLKSRESSPPMFLLKSSKPGFLTCSSCAERLFPKLSSLRPHFLRCCKKELRKESGNQINRPRRKTEVDIGRCPLNECGIFFKKSRKYPEEVSQIVHIVKEHIKGSAACEKAIEISNAIRCGDIFPFLNTEGTIRESNAVGHTVLGCSKCEASFSTLFELSAHSRRYHMDKLKQCYFGCVDVYSFKTVSDYVTEADMVFMHHLFKHPTEDLAGWLATWSGEGALNQGKFRYDVTSSIDYVTKHKETGLFCAGNDTCKDKPITSVQGILCHLHDSSGNDDCDLYAPSAAAVRTVKRLMKKSVKPLKPTVQKQSTPRLARVNYALNSNCPTCKRSIIKNSLYSTAELSVFIHRVTHHPSSLSEPDRSSTQVTLKFPFVDVDATTVRCKETGTSTFVCAICSFESSTIKEFKTHAGSHEGVVSISTKKTAVHCSKCDDVIECNGLFASEEFSVIAHAINYHPTDEQYLSTLISQKRGNVLSSSNDVLTLLDCDATLKNCKERGRTCFVCLKCSQEFKNSLAFLHHSKQHIPRLVNTMACVMPCFSKARKEYTHNMTRAFYCHLCDKRISAGTSRTHSYDIQVSMMQHLLLIHSDEPHVKQYAHEKYRALASVFPYMNCKLSYATNKLVCVKCGSSASFTTLSALRKHALSHRTSASKSTSRSLKIKNKADSESEDLFEPSDDELSQQSKNHGEGASLQLIEETSFDPDDLQLTQEQIQPISRCSTPNRAVPEDPISPSVGLVQTDRNVEDLERLPPDVVDTVNAQNNSHSLVIGENEKRSDVDPVLIAPVRTKIAISRTPSHSLRRSARCSTLVIPDISEAANIVLAESRCTDVPSSDHVQLAVEHINAIAAIPVPDESLLCSPQRRRSPRRSAILSTSSTPKSGPIRRHKLKLARAVEQTPKSTRKIIRIGFDDTEPTRKNSVLVPEKGQTSIDRFLQRKSSLVSANRDIQNMRDSEIFTCSQEPITTLSDLNVDTHPIVDQQPCSSRSQALVSSWLMSNTLSELQITPKRLAEPLMLQDNMGNGLRSGGNLKSLMESMIAPNNEFGTPNSSCALGSLLPAHRLKELNLDNSEPADVSHMENVSGFKCPESGCTFVGLTRPDTKKHNLLKHSKTLANGEKLVSRDVASMCVICKQVFPNRVKLLTHISDLHKRDKDPFPCTYCSKLFPSLSRVREHERRMHEWNIRSNDVRSEFCSTCNERFKGIRNLKEHQRRVHRKRPAVDQ